MKLIRRNGRMPKSLTLFPPVSMVFVHFLSSFHHFGQTWNWQRLFLGSKGYVCVCEGPGAYLELAFSNKSLGPFSHKCIQLVKLVPTMKCHIIATILHNNRHCRSTIKTESFHSNGISKHDTPQQTLNHRTEIASKISSSFLPFFLFHNYIFVLLFAVLKPGLDGTNNPFACSPQFWWRNWKLEFIWYSAVDILLEEWE